MLISRKVRQSFNASGNGNTATNGEERLGPLSDDKRTGKYLKDPQTRRPEIRFLVILAAVMVVAGLCLGVVLNAQVRETMVRSAANVTAYHMELFLEPLTQSSGGTDMLSPDVTIALDGLLAAASSGRRLEVLRVWREDGTIAYSTNKAEVGTRQPNPELAAAFEGRDVAYFGHLSSHGDTLQEGARKPLLEAYFPLRQQGSGKILAVGEFYEDATELRNRIEGVEVRIWSVIFLASIAAMSLLAVAAARASAGLRSSRVELAQRLRHERELARQNADLRRAAEEARLSAIVTNENLLAKIGSDIHDGPIQVLTLLVMKLSSRSSQGQEPGKDTSETALASQVLHELRDISQGLVLPELEDSDANEAIMLAADKHESLTGTEVSVELEELPQGLENAQITCLYRIVQECLSNAYRHAAGEAQAVHAHLVDGCIEVRVSDGGPGFSLAPSKHYTGVGMAGLAKRLQALGGSLTVSSAPGRGTVVIARLPV